MGGDLLAQGQAWLAAQQKAHASRPVVYRRGGASVTLDATIGKTDFEYTDGYGATIIDQSRDYLILTAELVLGDERTLPQAGDTIEETDGQQRFTYEVTVMGPEPAYRYSDPGRVQLRIHTKLSKSENL